MKPEPSATVKSADRALDILDFVADAAAPPSFTGLMTGTGIPRSSLFHLLNNLQARGYLRQEDGGYRLGERLRHLAARLESPSPLAAIIAQLRRLSAGLQETSGFYRQREDRAEVVATVAGGQALGYTMRVGELAPLYAVSAGKIMLARLPDAALEAYLARVVLQPVTPRTLRSVAALRAEIHTARQEGFAYSREEFTPGITGIAIAVMNGPVLLGALNLAVPTARFTPKQAPSFKRELTAAAQACALCPAPGIEHR